MFTICCPLSAYYQHRFFDLGGTSSLFYGDETAAQFMVNGNLNFNFRDVWIFDRVNIMPGAMAQWGHNTVFFVRQMDTPISDLYEIVQAGDYPDLQRMDYRRVSYLIRTDRPMALYAFLRRRSFTDDQITSLVDEYQDAQFGTEKVFGLLNYSFNLAVMLTINQWMLTVSYTYNIPVSLPGESYTYPANSFLSASLSYTWPIN